jgi:sec-independent protein translocase protein TatA
MFGFGTPELFIILFIVILIFGGSKLPELGSALGAGIKNFKKATEGRDAIETNPKEDGTRKGA